MPRTEKLERVAELVGERDRLTLLRGTRRWQEHVVVRGGGGREGGEQRRGRDERNTHGHLAG